MQLWWTYFLCLLCLIEAIFLPNSLIYNIFQPIFALLVRISCYEGSAAWRLGGPAAQRPSGLAAQRPSSGERKTLFAELHHTTETLLMLWIVSHETINQRLINFSNFVGRGSLYPWGVSSSNSRLLSGNLIFGMNKYECPRLFAPESWRINFFRFLCCTT